MKRILILSVTAGNGHNSCAQAMKQFLEDNYDVTVEIVDLLKEFSSKLNYWISDTGYNLAVEKLLPLYNLFYNHYKKSSNARRYSNACQSTCLSTVSGLLKKILAFRPDAIYCTHYICAVALTDLRLVYPIPARIVVTCLDYTYSPFWESTIGVDYFVIPNEDFVKEGIEKGFRSEQLLPYGIPVKENLHSQNRLQIREELGLNDKFTVIVTFGGGNWKGAYKIFKLVAKALEGKNAQIIVINGKDKDSFRKIGSKDWGVSVLNVGYTNEVPLYLAASDLFVGKGGGLSTTEAINATLPMLLYDKTPAQEQNNISYLTQRGVARSFRNEKTLKEQILHFYNNVIARNEVKKNIKFLSRDALKKTAEILISAPQVDYKELVNMNIDIKNVRRDVHKAMKYATKVYQKEI